MDQGSSNLVQYSNNRAFLSFVKKFYCNIQSYTLPTYIGTRFHLNIYFDLSYREIYYTAQI